MRDLLSSLGAVVIEGPKACGKTETARQAAFIDPSLVLEGATPRLLDEWQLAPADDVTRHTGAGRMARLRMRPMSLNESGHSTGQVSLSEMLGGAPPRASDPGLKVRDLAERIAVGGWPGLLDQPVPQALRAVRAYVDEVRRTDIQRVEGVAHDPEKVLLLMRSLARNVSTMTSLATLARDVGAGDEALAKNTVGSYHEALTRLMVVEDQPAWAPHLRSRSRVRTSPRRHFVDPSVAVAVLRATPERLLGDLNLLGFLFESLVVRDLRVYA